MKLTKKEVKNMKTKKDKKKLKKEKARFLAEWWQMLTMKGYISYEECLGMLCKIMKEHNVSFRELFKK